MKYNAFFPLPRHVNQMARARGEYRIFLFFGKQEYRGVLVDSNFRHQAIFLIHLLHELQRFFPLPRHVNQMARARGEYSFLGSVENKNSGVFWEVLILGIRQFS